MMATLYVRAYDFSQQLLDSTERILGSVKDPYTLVIKVVRCAKAVHKLAEKVFSVSEFRKVVFSSLDALKVFHIPLFGIQSYRALYALFQAHDTKTCLFKAAKLHSSLKKFTTGVSTCVICLKDRITFPKQLFSTLDFLRYVFLPNTAIEGVVSGHKSIKLAMFYAKSASFLTSVSKFEEVERACVYFEGKKEELRQLKVCTEKNSLDERIKKIKQMSNDCQKITEANEVFSQLKNRLQHQITHKTVRTCCKVLSIAVTIIGCTSVWAPLLAAFELALTTSRLATFLYGRCSV